MTNLLGGRFRAWSGWLITTIGFLATLPGTWGAEGPATSVNLSLMEQGGIPTGSDPVDSYDFLPGNFADGKPDTV